MDVECEVEQRGCPLGEFAQVARWGEDEDLARCGACVETAGQGLGLLLDQLAQPAEPLLARAAALIDPL